jgi:nucleotide-binding universal stress UspA family protein
MVFLIPYDGSAVAEAALDRAVEFGKAFEEDILAVSFVPTGSEYAQRRKWIEPDEEFALEAAKQALERKIEETTDDAERNYTEPGATGMENGITREIQQVAEEVDASVLFVGAHDEQSGGPLETPFGTVSQAAEYDIHVVRSVG